MNINIKMNKSNYSNKFELVVLSLASILFQSSAGYRAMITF